MNDITNTLVSNEYQYFVATKLHFYNNFQQEVIHCNRANEEILTQK